MSSLFKSTLNTRFLPTEDKRYIRSDYPANLSQDEISWLLENDFKTIIDLREEREYRIKPCILENMPEFIYYHLPVTGGGDIPESREAVQNMYLSMLDEKMDIIIDTILRANSKVMFFCNAGKDRTGVVSALLLKRLGCDRKLIIEDYMETKANMMDFLKSYVNIHPEIDINIIIPSEDNIEKILLRQKVK